MSQNFLPAALPQLEQCKMYNEVGGGLGGDTNYLIIPNNAASCHLHSLQPASNISDACLAGRQSLHGGGWCVNRDNKGVCGGEQGNAFSLLQAAQRR